MSAVKGSDVEAQTTRTHKNALDDRHWQLHCAAGRGEERGNMDRFRILVTQRRDEQFHRSLTVALRAALHSMLCTQR